jgi:hypothetical protein
MPLRFLIDENLRRPLWSALQRHNSMGVLTVDAVRVGDLPELPLGAGDDVILQWCEQEARILVSVDYRTMPLRCADRLASGRHYPGVLLLRRGQSLNDIVDALVLIAHVGRDADYADLIRFVP